MIGDHDGARRPVRLLRLAAVALAFAGSATAAGAQYYEGPPGGYRRAPAYEEQDYPPPPPRRRVVREVGYNCDAVQRGLTGPRPYSCPLPGPRPLGARCFCDLPIASFSPAQTAVGHVIP
ncbi:hypothetical protein [Methylobacterium sp. J-076]|uniref:hypothetical protein n=1 Tax=Methylobacterium sp. J-076 TaxID=2836655 RepID=UPI001FB95404|nr:hypothetical protein [Methylobacterium sp. J-076]MCJ2013431.1 hypothetical protein [Methylobacterium sp. J-076]